MSNGKKRGARVFRHTVRPGISTPLFLKTVPGATCLLHRPEDTDPERRVRLFADDDGIICLHVRPSVEADDVAKFVIECSADGRVTHYPLELRASKKETPKMPFPAKQRPARKKRGTIRPALSEEEVLHISQEELLERGYPPRPDPEALAPFKTWLRLVSVPMTKVEPRLVTNIGVSHQTVQTVAATSPNWSGFELRGGPFDLVQGHWNVPVALLGETGTTDWSAFWVGIDGDSTSDLVQAGTEQNITDFYFPFIGNFSITSYYAWTEFLPQQQYEQVISNFSVNPGDEMFVQVFLLGNSFAQFLVFNLSAQPPEFTILGTPFGNTVVGATEAEWIMERPTVNSAYSDLAGYIFTTMRGAVANIPGVGISSYDGIDTGTGASLPNLESLQITMKNGNDILSQVLPLDEQSMFFQWSGFH